MDDLMALADAVQDPKTPARPDPAEAGSWKAGGPVSSRHGGRDCREEGRAGLTPPGAVPSMPQPLGPPRFGDGPPRPWPNPRPNPAPVPTPPPPFAS